MPEISETFHTLKLAQIGENASNLPMILPDFRLLQRLTLLGRNEVSPIPKTMPINEARSIVLPNAP
jgi:hypothetical protein